MFWCSEIFKIFFAATGKVLNLVRLLDVQEFLSVEVGYDVLVSFRLLLLCYN